MLISFWNPRFECIPLSIRLSFYLSHLFFPQSFYFDFLSFSYLFSSTFFFYLSFSPYLQSLSSLISSYIGIFVVSSVKIFSSLFQPRSVDFSPSAFSPILHSFVAHTRISSSVPLAVTASAIYKFCCYLSSILISFSLIYLYSQPIVASRFFVTVSVWLRLAFHLSISFRLLSVCVMLYPLFLSSLFVHLIFCLFSVVHSP